MNDIFLKKSLLNTPETAVKVSASLHQDIIRAVRLSEPPRRKPVFNRLIPALGAAVIAAIAIGVIFYLPPTIPVSPSPVVAQGQPQTKRETASLQTLGDSLLALSKTTPLPEQALREELERLKSDLERFDFRS